MKKIAALALLAALAVIVVVAWSYFGHEADPFTANYHLIQRGTTHEEAVRLLGPSADEYDPGASCGRIGDHVSYWRSPDGEPIIQLAWDLAGVLIEKQLRAEDGTVVLFQKRGGGVS
jgi:hypothetical protein